MAERKRWRSGKGGGDRCSPGLLDIGADDTKFPLSVATRLGVEVDRTRPILFRGVGGEAVGFFGEVALELRQSPTTWVWTARVAFLPDPPDATREERTNITLGHTGFFRYFHVTFDYQRQRVRIRPNRLFGGRQA